MKPFVLSDGTVVNSYGFRVRTGGINFLRFDANPVMLAEHINSIATVLGKWINRETNGAQLLATPEFDEKDDDAVKVMGKVDRGYVKGASIGIGFDPSKMELMPDGVWELTECELYEASICAIPSNKSALRLYAVDSGKLLTEDEVKLSIASLAVDATHENFKSENKNMKKVILSLSALTVLDLQKHNTTEGVDADLVSASIVELSTRLTQAQADLTAQKTAYNALKLQLDAANEKDIKELLDAAQLAGKFDATKRTEWETLAKQNLSLAKSTLESIPAKQSLAGQVNNPAPGGEVKTADDFQKLTIEQQLAFKQAHPDAYKKLFA